MGSMRMSLARARIGNPQFQAMVQKQFRRGDPGFFSFLGGLAKTVGKVAGFIPGVGTAISTVEDIGSKVLGAIGGGGGASPAAPHPKARLTGGRGGPSFQLARGVPSPSVSMARGGQAFDSVGNVTQAGFSGSDNGQTDPVSGLPVPRGGRSGPVGASNIRGHHLNRSSYTLKDGTHVEKGTKLVTNRRRNPGNPRALHRAVSRMASFQHMARRVEGQLQKVARKSLRGTRSASGMRGHKPGCGCVGCRRR